MSAVTAYEYGRLWVPLYDTAALAVTRPVYLIEAADGFEGRIAEKNTTLVGVFNELGRSGWLIEMTATRVTDPSPEFQLLIDATLDEADGGSGGTGGPGSVTDFDVYGMRREVVRG